MHAPKNVPETGAGEASQMPDINITSPNNHVPKPEFSQVRLDQDGGYISPEKRADVGGACTEIKPVGRLATLEKNGCVEVESVTGDRPNMNETEAYSKARQQNDQMCQIATFIAQEAVCVEPGKPGHAQSELQNNNQKSPKFKCTFCDKWYILQRSLDRHQRWKHFGVFDYHCSICNCSFGEKRQLARHQSKVGHFPVGACSQRAESVIDEMPSSPGAKSITSAEQVAESNLKLETELDVSRFVVEGSDCKKKLGECEDEIGVVDSEREVEKDQTEKTVSNHDIFQVDKKKKSVQLPYRCNQCDKMYSCKNSVYRHIRQFHCNQFPCYCDQCDKPFEDRGKLRKHKAKCDQSKKGSKGKKATNSGFECGVCGCEFESKQDIDSHMVIHTEVDLV